MLDVFFGDQGLSSSEHIMGVVVNEMIIETTMAVERVTANSRKRRPTMPPIIRRGMNTAMSETLMEKTVKPISWAPLRAASTGLMPLLLGGGRCSP